MDHRRMMLLSILYQHPGCCRPPLGRGLPAHTRHDPGLAPQAGLTHLGLHRPPPTWTSTDRSSDDRVTTVKFLLRDRDSRFTTAFDAVFTADHIRIMAIYHSTSTPHGHTRHSGNSHQPRPKPNHHR